MADVTRLPEGCFLSAPTLDPGDAAAIPVGAAVALVTAGAETRTLAAPTLPGQVTQLYFKTDGGDCVVTTAAPINVTGNNTITFADAGDTVILISVETTTPEPGADPPVAGTYAWRVLINDGAALSTV